MKPRKFI